MPSKLNIFFFFIIYEHHLQCRTRAPQSAVYPFNYPPTHPSIYLSIYPSFCLQALYHCSQLKSSPPPNTTKKPRMVRKMTAFPVITRPQAPHRICSKKNSPTETSNNNNNNNNNKNNVNLYSTFQGTQGLFTHSVADKANNKRTENNNRNEWWGRPNYLETIGLGKQVSLLTVQDKYTNNWYGAGGTDVSTQTNKRQGCWLCLLKGNNHPKNVNMGRENSPCYCGLAQWEAQKMIPRCQLLRSRPALCMHCWRSPCHHWGVGIWRSGWGLKCRKSGQTAASIP